MSCRRHVPLAPSCAKPHPCPLVVRRRVLAGTTLFSGLGCDQIAEVDRQFTARAYAANMTICRSARELFVLRAGRVKLTRATSTGTEVVVDIVLPGAMFGAMPGKAGKTYTETAETLTHRLNIRLTDSVVVAT